MKNPAFYFLMITAITFLSACKKEAEDDFIGCDPPSSDIPFQIKDKSSLEDLFFSANPKYQVEDIKVYKARDKARQNPIPLEVIGTDNRRLFLLPYAFSNPRDTMIIKIANTPDDLFIYHTRKSEDPCLPDQLEEPSFNGTAVLPEEGIFIFKK